MSGGHWNYLSFRLKERAEFAGEIWRLIGEIEHELDWGICGDTCYDCAKIRVIAALEAFFDTEATSAETSIRLLRSSEPECQRCRDWKTKQQGKRPSTQRSSALVEWEYEGKRYRGTVYEVEAEQ